MECGHVLHREFTDKMEVHRYLLDMQPGEKIQLRVVPTGDTLFVRAFISEPAGELIGQSEFGKEVNLNTARLSARGDHTITIQNAEHVYAGSPNSRGWGRSDDNSRLGFYELFLGCVHSDGQKTEPGSSTPSAAPGDGVPGDPGYGPDLGSFGEEAAKIQGYTQEATETLQGAAKAVEAFKGFFKAFRRKDKREQARVPPSRPVYIKAEQVAPAQPPVYAQPLSPVQHGNGSSAGGASSGSASAGASAVGLRPADLAGRIFPRLGLGMPLEGTVTAGGDIAGCRFVADAGERLELTFERLSGDQDLTLIVVDPFGALAFETRLLANPRVETVLALRTRGEYTVGVAAAGSSAAGGTTRFKADLGAASE